MRSLLPPKSVRALAVLTTTGALLLPTTLVPAQAATVLDTEYYKVKPSGKKTRFELLLKDGGTVFLTFSVKKKGGFTVLDKKKVHGTFVDGSTDAAISDLTQDYDGAPDDGGQGLVTWNGPTEDDDYAEYFGFDLTRGKLSMYGG